MASSSFVRSTLLVLAAAVLAAAAAIVSVAISMRPDVSVTALDNGATISPAALNQVTITASEGIERAEVLLDGAAAPVVPEGDGLRLAVPELDEGLHTLVVRLPHRISPLPAGGETRIFTVDAAPPELAVQPVEPAEPDAPAKISGSTQGASSLHVQNKPIPLTEDGTFTVQTEPGTTAVTVEARDKAGNAATRKVPVPVRHPGMRAVHMTASAWSAPSLRDPVLQLAREKRIDAVQLDIKDESGEIGYQSAVPLAKEIGATRDYYDARAALDQLHQAGVRVVGRIVAFRDPILGRHSWENGQRDRVVQQANGTPWTGGYGEYAFTNFANPEVRAYNVALAEEAAKLGFDEILYDYVRRPDGAIAEMRFPGITTTPEQAVADFVGQTRPVVHRHGALLGASVFGIAVTRPTQIAQDIPELSKHADYIAPMVYPSHWGPGEYGVANPESQPYDITKRSLDDFAKQAAEGDGSTAIIPWLQAFSLGVSYGPEEIRAQIKAAEDAGIQSFLLWNANCRYDPEALAPR
ncbi:hypothetical protein SAMN05216266_12368 [Amycolatopsis marina]|uniref:DUF4015 domain-containing protein n=1 Tax=Amycolatopsis marina TaxID=490629 RepID=A0A1I1CEJ6_9PSEU|nr:putative glycoside hydrolase [Amycolatopsis marina]SFB59318.1 hypothetical protein SAMN05216266_12368 [Amycolatopsis marina]